MVTGVGDVFVAVLDSNALTSVTPYPYYYKGIYDEIRIWNRALSQKEIKESMEMGSGQLFPVKPLGKLTTTWASIKKQ